MISKGRVSVILLGLVTLSCIASIKSEISNDLPPLTATLAAWISSQCEMIVDEMEAIVKNNAESSSFSVVNYLRYLSLYDSLAVIATKKDVPELAWVAKKARAFSRVYKAAMDIVSGYLVELDEALRAIEAREPKSKQVTVSPQWLKLYETIRYIATHAPKKSELAANAANLMNFSPTGNGDKVRSTRYELKTKAFSR